MCTVIEEKDVTPVNLSLELEKAVISQRLDEDGSIYVNEPGWFPFWINLKRGNGLVMLVTHTNFKREVSKVQRLEFCNEINSKFFMLTANVSGQTLRVDYSLLYSDGLTRETFIRTCRTFNQNISRAMNELDPDDSIVLAPGEDEEMNISGDSE
jgi:hypothetical protein